MCSCPCCDVEGWEGPCNIEGDKGPARNESHANWFATSFGNTPLRSKGGTGLVIAATGGRTGFLVPLFDDDGLLLAAVEKLSSNGFGSWSSLALGFNGKTAIGGLGSKDKSCEFDVYSEQGQINLPGLSCGCPVVTVTSEGSLTIEL